MKRPFINYKFIKISSRILIFLSVILVLVYYLNVFPSIPKHLVQDKDKSTTTVKSHLFEIVKTINWKPTLHTKEVFSAPQALHLPLSNRSKSHLFEVVKTINWKPTLHTKEVFSAPHALHLPLSNRSKSHLFEVVKTINWKPTLHTKEVFSAPQALHLPLSNRSKKISKDARKTILLWHVPFGDVSMVTEYLFEKAEFGSDLNKLKDDGFEIKSPLCGNCKFTFNRSLISTSDAVLFHGLDVVIHNLPNASQRRPEQLYVYWSMETIPHSEALRKDFMKHSVDQFYNVTMTMRTTSDIYSPYGSISWLLKMIWYKRKGNDLMERIARTKVKILTSPSQLQTYVKSLPVSSLTTIYNNEPKIPSEILDLIRGKDRLSIWIVSNCGWSSGNSVTRKTYLDLLKKAGLKVDVFGKCGVNFPVASRWDPAFHAIVSKYKFYFAFENSYHCKDYTTEKLWLNALYSGAVPVIFGPHKDDVAKVLPPKSYLHVEEYSDYQELINYIQYLDRNYTAYAEYLEWRSWVKYLDENGEFDPKKIEDLNAVTSEYLLTLYRYATAKPIGYCALCSRLYDADKRPSTVKNLNEWIQDDRPQCSDFALGRKMFWSSQKKTT